jgi:hypothetical protein
MNTVYAFKIDSSTGGLTENSSATFAVGSEPMAIANEAPRPDRSIAARR